MAPGGNIIIGHNSGNVGNSGTCMSVQEEEPAGHQFRPNGTSINYTNVEIHIGLFGGQIKLPDHKRHRTRNPLMMRICAAAIGVTIYASTPMFSHRENAEIPAIEESAVITIAPHRVSLNCTCDMKKKRKRL